MPITSLPLPHLYLQWPASWKSEGYKHWRELALWTWKDESYLFSTSFPCISLLDYFIRLFFRSTKNSSPDNRAGEDLVDSVHSLHGDEPHSIVETLYFQEQCCLLVSFTIYFLDEKMEGNSASSMSRRSSSLEGFSRLRLFKTDAGELLKTFNKSRMFQPGESAATVWHHFKPHHSSQDVFFSLPSLRGGDFWFVTSLNSFPHPEGR